MLFRKIPKSHNHYIVVLPIASFREKKGGRGGGGDPLSESNNTLARTCYMIDNDRANLRFLTVLVIESRFKRSFSNFVIKILHS